MKNRIKLLLITLMLLCCFSGCVDKEQNAKETENKSEEVAEEEISDIDMEEQDVNE